MKIEKLKAGFIGIGGVAATHLKILGKHKSVDIVAVCDIVKVNAVNTAEEINAKAYTDADEMLEKETLDVVFLCVPPFAHKDLEQKIVEKGIHLMVEKPVGLNMEEVYAKQLAIQKSGVICATGYCLRYLDTVQKAKEYLIDKEIAMVRGYYLSSFVETSWYRMMSKSGGQLVEQATHIMDLIRYLNGDFKTIYANMALKVSDDIKNIDIPDVTSVSFTFENGAVGHLDCSFTQNDHRMGVELLGNKFRVMIDGTNLTILEDNNVMTYSSEVDFYEEQDNAFIEAILTGKTETILSDYTNGLKTLETTLAANESQKTGNVISITKTES
ncbi:Gfo/Idh/MocA family protein [Oceanobacillus sp. CFH 90083]|uniref:Gfo/Idh/MocA family protein n=1 Tax=Oceanobacillus sp. CFH 90083 TaxID=2592336 RepID=UPI00128D82CA|nr:Gfo/Idh/MocA family oxidoreductase [Oceanobacillus sp. CFH 90083]